MRNLRHLKTKKKWLVKLLPLVVWMSVILIKTSLGMADPTFPPPTPPGGNS